MKFFLNEIALIAHRNIPKPSGSLSYSVLPCIITPRAIIHHLSAAEKLLSLPHLAILDTRHLNLRDVDADCGFRSKDS